MVGERCEPVLERGEQAGAGSEDGLTDEELLGQFLESSEAAAEDAFAALMRRHGPMVLAVCRHVLGRHQDAEDAFQATFLVLARKAGSIRARSVLGRWLYEVAYRSAMRARMSSVRRQAYERQGAQMTAVSTNDRGREWQDLRPVLHEELQRLPDNYRTPIVLCYLEGTTNEEAARLLQWPVGTVKGRLSRARDMLRSRLDRRGISLTLALLVAALSRRNGMAETVPEELVSETTRLAVSIKGPNPLPAGAVPPRVADLMERSLGRSVAMRRASTLLLLVTIVAALTHAFGSMTSGRGTDLGSGIAPLSAWAASLQRALAPSSPAAAGCHGAPTGH